MKFVRKPNEKLSVLVVDDESDIRDTLVTFLEMMEVFSIIVEASDGAEASLKFKNQSFDLVITDLTMPKVQGIELVERIKREDIVNKTKTPIMILSGNVTSEEIQKALQFGVKYVLTKPCTAEQFFEKVNIVIQKELKHRVKIIKD